MNIAQYFGWIGRKGREEASTGDAIHLESLDKSWSSNHSTSPYGATLHPSIQHPEDQSQSFSKSIQRYASSHIAVIATIPNFICSFYVAGPLLSPVPENLVQTSLPLQSNRKRLIHS